MCVCVCVCACACVCVCVLFRVCASFLGCILFVCRSGTTFVHDVSDDINDFVSAAGTDELESLDKMIKLAKHTSKRRLPDAASGATMGNGRSQNQFEVISPAYRTYFGQGPDSVAARRRASFSHGTISNRFDPTSLASTTNMTGTGKRGGALTLLPLSLLVM